MIPNTAVQVKEGAIFTPTGMQSFDYINFLSGTYDFDLGIFNANYAISKKVTIEKEDTLQSLYNGTITVPRDIVETWNKDDVLYLWIIAELGLQTA